MPEHRSANRARGRDLRAAAHVIGWFATLLALSVATASATNRCRLLMSPPLPVTMQDLRPVISANINGSTARFIVDTGSFFDILSPAAAAEFKLPLSYTPPWFYVSGVGGAIQPRMAIAKAFEIAGFRSRNAEFLVADNDFRGGVDGIVGQNLLRVADADYDFANGALRLAKAQDCRGPAVAYWAAELPIGMVRLRWTNERQPLLMGKAAVNGHKIEVLFDTGDPRSILSLAAAKRAGITPDSPGVTSAGAMTGIGKKTIQVWSAPVARFEIGGETIERTRMLIGDVDLSDVDMLLGSDFFLSHHVYVAYGQDRLYFTYNGGVVFDLNARRPAQAAGGAQAPAPDRSAGTASAATAPTPTGNPPQSAQSAAALLSASVSNEPADAAGFIRRGMAEASRRDFPEAIADLTRACGLDPESADCRYQRGLAYWLSAQPQLALVDFNAALTLDPNDYEAHLARARLQLPKLHAGVEDDLDAADRLAPQEADLRWALGALYHAIGQYAGAVHQFDLWIDYHANDNRLPSALETRCGLQAGANIDLDRALDDCNQALSRLPSSVHTIALTNRGLVYLRLGQLDRAIADATAAIQLRQAAQPFYLRGLAELRKGMTTQGRRDFAIAQKLQPAIAEHYAAMGLTP